MTYLANVPRASHQQCTAVAPRRRLRRPAEALSYWANRLGEMNDMIDPQPSRAERIEAAVTCTLAICLAAVGLLWTADAIWMAVVVDPMLGDF